MKALCVDAAHHLGLKKDMMDDAGLEATVSIAFAA